ncbi:MAG: sigma-70 family RNA polymerase sigma factor [Planctomycetota bacterium]
MWPEADNTLELLQQVQRGDQGAVDPLLARHRAALRRMVQLRLDPALAARVDASDIVQDALIEANERLSEFVEKRPMPFHLWIRRIALDRLIDAHRRHRTAKKRSVDRERKPEPAHNGESSIDLMARLSAGDMTPAAAAIRAELMRRAQAAFGELSDDDREMILMRHFECLSNREVAEALGLTDSAAAMRYMRAFRRLRSILGEEVSKSD